MRISKINCENFVVTNWILNLSWDGLFVVFVVVEKSSAGSSVYYKWGLRSNPLPSERRDVSFSRWAQRMGGGSVGCPSFFFFFWTWLRRRCFLSSPSVWKVCRFHYSLSRFTAAVAMFLHGGPRGKGQALWPCESGLSAVRGKEGIGCKPQRHTRGFHVQFQRQSCFLAACYHWQESRTSLLWAGLKTPQRGNCGLAV